MARIDDILKKIYDNAQVVVDLPSNKDESIRCKALLIKKETPQLELLCVPNAWEDGDLKIGSNCNLVIEHKGDTVNLIARLDSIAGPRRLNFTAREPISPETLRDYFRVSVSLPIEASYIAGAKETNAQTWRMNGTTIDLSGSGVLVMFDQRPPSNNRIQLIISIPHEETPVVCLANVVRTYRLRQKKYQVAFHFESISGKTRDVVVSYCLHEERRQLRENVRTV